MLSLYSTAILSMLAGQVSGLQGRDVERRLLATLALLFRRLGTEFTGDVVDVRMFVHSAHTHSHRSTS
jgi:hypothetical protein